MKTAINDCVTPEQYTAQAITVLHENAGWLTLEQFGLLQVKGKDAASFLQSQLTNDINQLNPGKGQFSCLLDRKAHVEAYFHIFKTLNDQSFYILIEKEQIAKLVENLEQYVFAAQVEFLNLSKEGQFIALQGPRANRIFALLQPQVYISEITENDVCDIEYGGSTFRTFRHSLSNEIGYFFWITNDDLKKAEKAITGMCLKLDFTKLNNEAIEIARIEAGIPKFGIDFDSNNILPETGLIDQTVNYKKGCFVGQEILARVRSHGVPARALIGLIIDKKNTSDSIAPDSPILIDGEEIGMIKSSTFSPTLDKFIAIAILKRDYRTPNKTLSAQLGNIVVNATVVLPPFVQAQSNKQMAHRLYEEAVKLFVKESDQKVPIEAIYLLQEVLILDPQLEDAYEALAVILSKHDQLDEAIKLMKKLAQINPDSIMAHSNLSQFYVQQGLKELAEEEKANALAIRMRLAAAQMTNKQTEEAEKKKAERIRRKEMFAQVLAIDKQDFFANAGFGECLVAENDFAKAIPYLKTAIELKPIHLAAYLDLARAYKETNQKDLAQEVLNSGIAIATKRGEMPMVQKLQDEMKGLS